MDQELAEGRCDQAAEDHRGDGIEDLAARLLAAEHQGHQADARRQRRHQDGGEPLEAAPQDHRLRKDLAFLLHEVEVVRDQQDPVADGDPAQRDEAHQARHGQRLPRHGQGDGPADEGRGEGIEQLQHDPHRWVEKHEHDEHPHDRQPGEHHDQRRGPLLAFELAAVFHERPLGQRHLRADPAADLRHRPRQVAALRVAPDHDPATGVFPIDGVGPGSRADVGQLAKFHLPAAAG